MTIFRKILDYGVLGLIFFFFGLSLLFYFSKDAVPGEIMFGTKLGLEKVMITTSAILNKQVDAQIEFVARRYDEAGKVLSSKYGSESLKRLDSQVVETAATIARIENPTERKEAAAKYAAQLSYISTGLKQEQEKIITNTYSPQQYNPPQYNAPVQNQPVENQNSYPTSTPFPTIPPSPTNPPSQNQPVNNQPTNPIQNTNQNNQSSTPPAIVSDIDNTQTTIQQTINQMNQIQNNNGRGNENNRGNQYGLEKNDDEEKKNNKNNDKKD